MEPGFWVELGAWRPRPIQGQWVDGRTGRSRHIREEEIEGDLPDRVPGVPDARADGRRSAGADLAGSPAAAGTLAASGSARAWEEAALDRLGLTRAPRRAWASRARSTMRTAGPQLRPFPIPPGAAGGSPPAAPPVLRLSSSTDERGGGELQPDSP